MAIVKTSIRDPLHHLSVAWRYVKCHRCCCYCDHQSQMYEMHRHYHCFDFFGQYKKSGKRRPVTERLVTNGAKTSK